MTTHTVAEILGGSFEAGREVAVNGWIRTRRDSKAGLSFLVLNDGSCHDSLQVVANADLPNYTDQVLHLTTGCSVHVGGSLQVSQGKGQGLELQAHSVDIIGWVDDPETYPVPAKRHTFEYLREVAHLRPRTNTFAAVARVRHALSQAIHRYLDDQGFFWVHTPIITGSDCEGAGELFRVSTLDLANLPREPGGSTDFQQDFFGGETFLTVSGQLNVEAYCLALSRVYTFGPTFRAENSNTSRHLAEFWMIEPEIAFADLGDNATLAEDMLKSVLTAVLHGSSDDMAFFDQFIDKGRLALIQSVIDQPFERMGYSEAVNILKNSGQAFEFPVEWGLDLHSEHERFLCERHVGGPLVVTDYPREIKPFYMRLNDDDRTVAAMDVLVPGVGEIIGGSQREERIEVLDARMRAADLPLERYQWYRDLRRYGTVPHAGFGLGLERLLGYLTGMGNVRDLIPFPRTPRNARF